MSSCTSEPVLRGLSIKLSLSRSPEAQLVPRQLAFLLFPEQQEFVSHLTQERFLSLDVSLGGSRDPNLSEICFWGSLS